MPLGIKVAEYDNNFWDAYNNDKRKVVIYGAGNGYIMYKDKLPEADMVCDKNADMAGEKIGLHVELPEMMQDFKEPIYIIVTVIDKDTFKSICKYLETLEIDAVVFHAAGNIGIECDSFWGTPITYFVDDTQKDRKMKINLICNEPAWILNKFAIRMEKCLINMGIDVTISEHSREDVDLNHHIQFATYKAYPNDTLMISHVDSKKLFDHLKEQLQIAKLGICMSKETMDKLVTWGIRRDKLCYINPAHDGIIRPRKRVIGITHKTHEYDTRKRISALFEMLDGVDPQYFRFVIMGAGWENVIKKLNDMGFETAYYADFDMEVYLSIVPNFDYYLFTGFDEGSMGYLDAVSAGVKTIVTPQGYHLDNDYPIDYPCCTVSQFRDTFLNIQNDLERRVKSVQDWTWERYTKKHIDIWEYILRRKSLTDIYADQLKYQDGIFSMLLYDNRISFKETGTR